VTATLLCLLSVAMSPEQALTAFNQRAGAIRSVQADISLTLSDGQQSYATTGTVRYAAPDSFRLVAYRRVMQRQLAFDVGVSGRASWVRDHLRGTRDENRSESPAALLWMIGLRAAGPSARTWAAGGDVLVVTEQDGCQCVAKLDPTMAAIRSVAVYENGKLVGWMRVSAWTEDGLPLEAAIVAGQSRVSWTLHNVKVTRG